MQLLRRLKGRLPPLKPGGIAASVVAALHGQSGSANPVPSLGFDFTTGTIQSQRGTAVTPTFTRATTKTIIDWEGCVRTILSGEVPFDGQRRVRNHISNSFNLDSWAKTNTGTGVLPIVTSGQIAPDGTATAYRVQLDLGASFTGSDFSGIIAGVVAPGATDLSLRSFWIKSNTGSTQRVHLTQGSASDVYLVTATTTWQRVASIVETNNNAFTVSLRGVGTCPTTADVLVWHPLWETVTGNSNRNPSEYVSSGELAAPYHGANVDGVKYFRTLNGNTSTATGSTSGVVTEAMGAPIPLAGVGIGWLPGVNNSHFTTPDAAVNRFTGNLWCAVYIAPDQYSPGSTTYIASKYDTVGNQRSWLFGLSNTGGLVLTISLDGTATLSYGSSTGHGITNFTGRWVAFFRNAATGTLTFWTSFDGLAWTQLGNSVATTAGALFNSTSSVCIGSFSTVGGGPTTRGNYYRAQLSDTQFAASGAVEFDPNDWTSGGSWTSSRTGETWTLNGGAKVNKWPVMGYKPDPAARNNVLQSENFGTTWTIMGTPTRSAGALRCGSILLDLVGDDDAGIAEGYQQAITFSGDAVKSVSCHFAQGTSTSSRVDIFDNTAGTIRVQGQITWTNGIPTVTMTTGTALTGRTGQSGYEPVGNGVFRLLALTTAVTAANDNRLRVFPATNAAGDVTATGNAYFGGVMAEDNTATVSPYIPTTTATVTVNADILFVSPLGSWYNAAAGTLACHWVVGNTVALNKYIASFSNGTNVELIAAVQSTAAGGGVVFVGGVPQANLSTGALTAGNPAKEAFAWKANDFALSLNGAAPVTDVAGTIPTVTQLGIGFDGGGVQHLVGGLRTLDYYNTRLTNAQLQALSA